jgi:hypothetical protein
VAAAILTFDVDFSYWDPLRSEVSSARWDERH